MWNTPFDESMLDRGNIIVRCMTEEDAIELFKIFESRGMTWCSGRPANTDRIHFMKYGATTCYYVSGSGCVSYGSQEYADGEERYTKCTFGGVVTLPDVDIPGDACNLF